MMRPASCFGVPFCQGPRSRYQRRASRRREPAVPRPAADRSQDFSLSSVANDDKNVKWQCKPEVFPCENQDGNRKMSPCGRRFLSIKRSRDSSPLKLVIKLEDSDEECDLVVDVPPQAIKKKTRICGNFTNDNKKEWSAVVCAEELCKSAVAYYPVCTGEKSGKNTVLCKNSRSLNSSKRLCNVSQKANIYFLNVNTDTLRDKIDPLPYSEYKHVSSVAPIEVDIKKGILKQGNAETKKMVEAFVQKHSHEDSKRVPHSILHTGHSSKDGTTIERPYKEIITNIEESQRIKENARNDIPEDTYPYPMYYLNKKESETVMLSLSAENVEHSGEDTEDSESDDPLEECQRIFNEFEELQKKNGDKQTHGGNVDLNLLETKVHNKKEVVPFKTSPWQQGHAEVEQAHWEFAAEVKVGQAVVATTSKQKRTTSGLLVTQFQSTGGMDSSNCLEVQPIEIGSGKWPILRGGNAATAMPRECSVRSFKRTIPVPHKPPTRKRCSIPESQSKVPLETRQRYVTCFLSECFKICSTVNEAFNKALIEEQSVYDRSGSKKMYLNFAVKTLKKLRDEGQLSNSRSSSGTGSMKSEKEKAFTGGALYELLKHYLLTEKQLNENNFPRPNPEKSGSAILPGVVKAAAYSAFKRVCCRCGKIYAVSSSGEHRRKEECNYHSGRLLEQKVPGGTEKHYSCCGRVVGSDGCQTAKLHVHDGRSEKLEGFMKTFTKSPPSDGFYGVYALDCEMCYTTHGLELTRVTVVDAKLHVVYDTFVKPDGEVIDYDLRLSGVMEDNLKNTTPSLRSVQAILLNLFSADTVLIGHNLEKTLFALKMIHDMVVDTSVVFPHRLGLPHKRTLRSLMAEYLRRIHQDDVTGHNSREDAIACMELILWKAKEDDKRRKW